MSISEGSVDLAGSGSTNGWLNASGFVTGTISPSSDIDWYRTFLVANVDYTFGMSGVNLDAYLVLRNAGGVQVTVENRGGANFTEILHFRPTVSGYYYVDAESYRASLFNSGSYVIALTSNTPDDFQASMFTASTLTVGQPKAGNLEMYGDADWHAVQLVAGKTYIVTAPGSMPHPYLKIFDANGLQTGYFAADLLRFTADRTGLYYVEVSGNDFTDAGQYELLVREPPEISVALVAATEASPQHALVFELTLSYASPVDISVRVDTGDETAVAGLDYSAVHRVVTIPRGQSKALVSVPLLDNDVFQPTRALKFVISAPVNAVLAGSGATLGLIRDDDTPPGITLPTDSLLPVEWHLYTMRAFYAWEIATGRGVKVGVFDQGIDASNPDLRANTNLQLGVNARNLSAGGAPVLTGDLHGTYVAGVIAASRDGQGTVGMAYDATLVPIYSSLAYGPQYLAEIANAFKYAKSLDVLNNSWGFGNKLQTGTNWAFYDNSASAEFAPAFAALKDLVSTGRKGLGTVVVQSAGNGYDYGDDTNLHNFQNSRYIITVGATDYFGHASVFSTTGASILVSAPGGGGGRNTASILTTDRAGDAGQDGDHAYVDGTSFAAPIVSGIVALMLEANPRLGYRDIQQILAYTARKSDVDVGDWLDNGATNWNGGGMHYHALTHATGFGQADALAAVRLAAGWDAPALTAANIKEVSSSKSVNAPIPDNGQVYSTIDIAERMVVERVDVTINIQHPYIGDLSILLTSPSGTTSFLMYRPAQGALSAYGSSQDDVHFTFDTVLDWGEGSQGAWLLGVYDDELGEVGRFLDWKLTLIGRPDSPDDTYVYTNEYPDLVIDDPGRAVLRDVDGGTNTINTAALGLDNRIDLSGHTDSLLNGARLTLAQGTSIRKAIGGDGNDTLIASDAGCVLRGMGGDDTLVGGKGIDTAVFGAAWSATSVALGAGNWNLRSEKDGADSIAGIERLQFADAFVAIDIDGRAGRVAKALGAVFGPAYVHDERIVGVGLYYADQMNYDALLGLALGARLGANPSQSDVVRLLYTNLAGVAPSASDETYYIDMMKTNGMSIVDITRLAADSALNQINVDLVGLSASGLEFVPFGG